MSSDMGNDIKEIRLLCERYLDGETSIEEERVIEGYFSCAEDIPADLMAVKVMMCGFEQAAAMTYSRTAKRKAGRIRSRRLIWGTAATAAVAAGICIGVFTREVYGYDSEGNAITDPQVALESTIYMSHLSKLETSIDIADMITQQMEDNN